MTLFRFAVFLLLAFTLGLAVITVSPFDNEQAEALENRCVVTAFALASVDREKPLAVIALNDSDENLALADTMAAALSERGFTVVEDEEAAALRVTFDAGVLSGGYDESLPSLGEVKAGSEGVSGQVNIWSNQKDSLLGGRRGGASSGQAPTSHQRIEARLSTIDGAKTFWEGDVRCELQGARRDQELAQAMAERLAWRMGDEAKGEAFTAE